MPPKTIKMAIADMLEDLSGDNFKRFCHQLLDRREEPQVRRNKVEGKSPFEIVEALVSTFAEPGAAQVSVEILKDMNCNNEAERLAEKTSGQSSKPSFSDTARPSAGATGAEGDCSGKHFVDKHRAELIDRVTNIASIMDMLLQKQVISQGIYDEILEIPDNRNKMRKLYSALHAAGRAGKDVFYELLEEKENYLMDELKNKK